MSPKRSVEDDSAWDPGLHPAGVQERAPNGNIDVQSLSLKSKITMATME